MIYPSCRDGDHHKCPIQYGNMTKCQCYCHKIIGVG